uniref:Uncharacterized protein LOC105642785 n=1 Tax=Rhizophora mucronata TaxID=61149 RepID=A0A2P2P3W3_RHIMU
MWATYSALPPTPVRTACSSATAPFPLTVSAQSRQLPRGSSSSIPHNKNQLQIKKQEQEEQKRKQQTAGLSGLDVLWAMQRAAAEKSKGSGIGGTKKNKKRRELSSAGACRVEDAVNYSKVRPLCIKSDWGARLEQLEKRLKDLSETK